MISKVKDRLYRAAKSSYASLVRPTDDHVDTCGNAVYLLQLPCENTEYRLE